MKRSKTRQVTGGPLAVLELGSSALDLKRQHWLRHGTGGTQPPLISNDVLGRTDHELRPFKRKFEVTRFCMDLVRLPDEEARSAGFPGEGLDQQEDRIGTGEKFVNRRKVFFG